MFDQHFFSVKHPGGSQKHYTTWYVLVTRCVCTAQDESNAHRCGRGQSHIHVRVHACRGMHVAASPL